MDLKKSWEAIPRKKRIIASFLTVAAITVATVFMVYVFSDPHTAALVKWVNVLLAVPVIIILLTYMIPVYFILDIFIAERNASRRPVRVPSRALWAVMLIGIILPTGLLVFLMGPHFAGYSDLKPTLLVLSEDGKNGIPDMAVCYTTSIPTDDTLYFGTDPDNLSPITDLYAGATNQHAFVLADLLPSTTYYYKIDNGPLYNFTTMPGSNDTLHFAFSSDVHFGAHTNNRTATVKILQQIADPSNAYNLMLCGGDMTEYGFVDSQWVDVVNTFSFCTSTIPFRPVIGNHDAYFGGEYLYLRYFYPDKLPTSSGSGLYYRIDINNIHIFMLDLEWGTESYTPEQRAWFESQIKTIPKEDWTIVVCHAMFYSSGISLAGMNWWDNREMIDTFADLFVQYDVDMVFSGHNHHLEVLNVSGVVYSIVGGFGGVPDPVREKNGTGSLWYMDHQFAFADVNISGNIATITFRTPENTVLKTFTLAK